MATQTQVTMVDDIDGSTDDVITCAFGLGDSQYEIDLGPENREELEKFLERFIAAARPVRPARGGGRRQQSSAPQKTKSDRERTHDIRQWATDNGYTVSARGRIGKDVREAYDAAH